MLPPVTLKGKGESRLSVFNGASVTRIYSPAMSMFTHTQERQKHRDQTAASASSDVKNRQMSRRRDGSSVMTKPVRENSCSLTDWQINK